MLAEVVHRLELALPPLRLVEGIAAFAALKSDPPAHLRPAAYVLPTAEGSLAAIRLAIAVSVVSEARHPQSLPELADARAAVSGVLLGWCPGESFGPLVASTGRVIAVRNGVAWWLETLDTGTPFASFFPKGRMRRRMLAHG